MMYGYQICIASIAFGEESIRCSCASAGGVFITISCGSDKSFYLQLCIGYIHQIQATGVPPREEFIGLSTLGSGDNVIIPCSSDVI